MGSRARTLAVVIATLTALMVPGPAVGVVQHDDQPDVAEEFDSRQGKIAPTRTQRALVARMGAAVIWNRFGTPGSVTRYGEFLARGIRAKNAVAAARKWLDSNMALFGLRSIDQLVFVSDTRMTGSRGHAVSFRQVFDGLVAQDGGLVTIGLTGSRRWKVAYASSSLTRDRSLAKREVTLSGPQAWVRAAHSVGGDVALADIRSAKRGGGWVNLAVAGEPTLQRVRLVAFPTVRSGVLPAYEAIVVDKVNARAYQIFVDAANGRTLARYSLVHNLAEAAAPVTQTFSGAVPAGDGACGPDHTFAVGSGIRALDGFADATLLTNDLVLFLLKDGVVLVEADTLFTPESFHFEPAGGVVPGDYVVRVCDFDAPNETAGWAEPRTYEGTFTIDDTLAPASYQARWNVFPANPPLNVLPADPWNNPSTDTRERWCWIQGDADDCDRVVGNLASRGPWDFNHKANVATFTTIGNNANSAESWLGPFGLLPGPNQFRPTSAGRDYTFPWTNDWFTRDCNTDNFVVGSGYDVSAATTNLFGMHNRMHDWAYFLGFTERNFNAQDYNFGLTERRQENDPLIGNVQAGAMIAGVRDNANMITLPDGMSPITNMYFWQPFAGAFYAPCVDGDYDMAVIGHEYTHLIENRMIGKGSNRTGHHAGAMGESVSDLTAMEYLNEYNFVPTSDENRYAVGAYATGNKVRAIRNYGMNFPSFGAIPEPSKQLNVNALNFSDMGYDVTGPQVHADGEIWSATNFRIRSLLNEKYDSDFPSDDAELQEDCADGELPAVQCPGNRRWIQLVFDSYLLMPTNPSMLQARDAVLAADLMRFGGANQRELWLGYARTGYGMGATSSNTTANTDTDPTPSFKSPLHGNAAVQFRAQTPEGVPVSARVYVGHYEGRVSPIADTNPATTGSINLDDTAEFAPGTYELVANAPGYGHVRFRQRMRSGDDKTVTIRFVPNLASSNLGATATGDGAATLAGLIDDTEGTNWTAEGTIDGAGNLSVDGKKVTVDLAGTEARRIRFVQVSALLLTPPAQNRFTALRQFEIWACNAGAGADCTSDAGYTKVYTSPSDAFPGDPPRPVAPHMILRSFDIPDTFATHLRLVVKTSQCTGGPDFQGNQDADPANDADCDSNVGATASRRFVRAAELQAFSAEPRVTPEG